MEECLKIFFKKLICIYMYSIPATNYSLYLVVKS